MILIGVYMAALVLLPLWSAARMHRKDPPLGDSGIQLLALGVLTILGVSAVVVMLPYWIFPNSIWGESESNVLAIAALAARGMPYYGHEAEPSGYALLYGPLSYLPLELVFRAGGGMLAAKGVAASAGLLGLAVLVRTIWTDTPNRTHCAVAALAIASYVLPHLTLLLLPKGDAWVFALSTLPILARRTPIYGPIVGLCAGLSVACKLPAGVGFLPYLADLYTRNGGKDAFKSILIGFAALLVGHSAGGDSIRSYPALLVMAKHHPIAPQLIGCCVLVILIPALIFKHYAPRKLELIDLALVVSTTLMLIPAGKIGAGSYHLAVLAGPFTMRLCELTQTNVSTPTIKPVDAFFGVIFAGLIAAMQLQAAADFSERANHAEASVIDALNAQSTIRGTVAIAPSHEGFQKLEVFQFVPAILHGAEAPVMVGALSDWNLAGFELSTKLTSVLFDCRITWLSSADVAEPWGATSTYWALRNADSHGEGVTAGSLFDESFREAFHQKFVKTSTRGPYDVWRCRDNTPTSDEEPNASHRRRFARELTASTLG